MGSSSAPNAEAIEGLRATVEGQILLPGDSGYDEARSIWNGMIDRRPGVVVRCENTDDVIAAVGFARDQGMLLSIHGGGHNVAGKAVCDDGVMIDLSRMKAVQVDAEKKIAVAEGGAQWSHFDRATQPHGLSSTGGLISSTGVAGLTLGGGIGYFTRSFGMACDNLTGADVVTADGRLVHTSESENPELLWALRGGGGNFGVVTSLEFRLHEVGPNVAVAQAFHRIEDAADMLRFHREYTANAPDEIACYALFTHVPPVEPFPADFQGQPCAVLVACSSGDIEASKERLQPIAEFGNPVVAFVDAMPYIELQQSFDAGAPHGARYYWKAHHLGGLEDGLLDTVASYCAELPGAFTIVGIEPLGGAFGRIEPGATAFPHRRIPYTFGIWTGWETPEEDEHNIAWTRRFYEDTRAHAAGAYVNYLGEDEGGRVQEAYGANFPRLLEVKKKWDPDNLFRVNQNIAS